MSISVPSASRSGETYELYRDEYLTILVETSGALVRFVRSSVLHPSPEVMERSFLASIAALDKLPRHRCVLLIDMRDAVGRNEPEYDAVLRRIRTRVESGFLRSALLLRTAAGMLQMKRVTDEDGVARVAFTSEVEAVEFLRSGVIPTGAQLASPKKGSGAGKKS